MSDQSLRLNKSDTLRGPEAPHTPETPRKPETRRIRLVPEQDELTCPQDLSATSRTASLREQIRTQDQLTAELTAQLQDKRDRCENLQHKLDELNAALFARQAEVSSNQKKTSELDVQLEQQNARIAQFKQMIRASDKELHQVLSALFLRYRQLSAKQEVVLSDLSQDLKQLNDMKTSEFVNQSLLAPLEERYRQLQEQMRALQQELTWLSQDAAIEADQRNVELNTRKYGGEEV